MAAIEFPVSPVSNQSFKEWIWDGSKWAWNAEPKNFVVEYLVVGGGGGGGTSPGGYASGGGGAGGVAIDSINMGPSSFTVSIGAGGSITGTSGEDSVFSIVTAEGGNRGGNLTANGGNLGGGVSGAPTTFSGGGGQDFEGGGGGGASEVGEGAPSPTNSGDGGDGLESSITGTATYYGGGGGGGNSNIFGRGGTPGTGGLGGGGNGGRNSTAGSGDPNTGGGGGGAGWDGSSFNGGLGGSGLVIIKYPETKSISTGPGLVFNTTTSGGYNITTYTSGTDTVTFS